MCEPVSSREKGKAAHTGGLVWTQEQDWGSKHPWVLERGFSSILLKLSLIYTVSTFFMDVLTLVDLWPLTDWTYCPNMVTSISKNSQHSNSQIKLSFQNPVVDIPPPAFTLLTVKLDSFCFQTHSSFSFLHFSVHLSHGAVITPWVPVALYHKNESYCHNHFMKTLQLYNQQRSLLVELRWSSMPTLHFGC